MTGARKTERPSSQRKITGGNADVCEKKGDPKIATQKMMKIRELKIDHSRDAVRVGEERRDETGTRQRNLGLEITAFVTICQVRN